MARLQLAIWTREFQRLRDGDRFFYGNDPVLSYIRAAFGIDYRRTLAQVISSNTDIAREDLNSNVFLTRDEDLPATTCTVSYRVTPASAGLFRGSVRITNTGTAAINRWLLRWQFANGQRVRSDTGIYVLQSGRYGRDVIAWPEGRNGSLAPGQSVDVGFTASWDRAANAKPPSFTLNGARCALG